MPFLNTDNLINSSELYQQILLFVFGAIAIILLILQVILLLKINLICVKLFVLLSFCIAYENFTLFANNFDALSTDSVYAANFFQALITPLFIIFLFEITLRLYEARSAVFFFIPFDQGAQYVQFRMAVLLWSVRLLAIGLFIINILVNYSLISYNGTDGPIAGNGGYISLSEHSNSNVLWLALIPPITLSTIGILICIQVYRYGTSLTWQQKKNDRWKLLILGVLAQTIGQIFGTKTYAITSNAGELCLLISSSILLLLIQRELAYAHNFAEYLHRSNMAFSYLDAVKSENIEVEQRGRRESIAMFGGVSKVVEMMTSIEQGKPPTSIDDVELTIENN